MLQLVQAKVPGAARLARIARFGQAEACPAMRCAQAHSSQRSALSGESEDSGESVTRTRFLTYGRGSVRYERAPTERRRAHAGHALGERGSPTPRRVSAPADTSVRATSEVTGQKSEAAPPRAVSKRVRFFSNSRGGRAVQNRRGAQRIWRIVIQRLHQATSASEVALLAGKAHNGPHRRSCGRQTEG